MSHKVVFIHTVHGLAEMFTGLCKELARDVRPYHVSDETLIHSVLAAGGVTPAVNRRICEHVVAAERFGADAIQVTCSSVSPCVDVAAPLVGVPVLKIDEAMMDDAVSRFERIGIMATTPTTLDPSAALLKERARLRGRSVVAESVLCAGAYEAFLAGKRDEYDRIVMAHLRDVMAKVEVVLLAQASMARVVDLLGDDEKAVPILSSPRPAIVRLAQVLDARASKGGEA